MPQVPPPRDASSGFVWPPTIYGIAFVIASLLAWRFPLNFAGESWRWPGWIAGGALIAAGAAIALAAEISFWRAGTATLPTSSTSRIVRTGIFRWTRNPMYLGMSLTMAGIGIAVRDFWYLAALPVAVFAVTKLAIEREEVYLTQKFGSEYTGYRQQVPRWFRFRIPG